VTDAESRAELRLKLGYALKTENNEISF